MISDGQYLTYNEYRELGGTLEETPFSLLEYEVRKIIDSRTQRRLVGAESTDIPTEVKMCEYRMIDSLNKYYESENTITSKGNITSESTDGYSIQYMTYEKVGDIINSKYAEFNDEITTYLTGVIYNNEHLLFTGIK